MDFEERLAAIEESLKTINFELQKLETTIKHTRKLASQYNDMINRLAGFYVDAELP